MALFEAPVVATDGQRQHGDSVAESGTFSPSDGDFLRYVPETGGVVAPESTSLRPATGRGASFANRPEAWPPSRLTHAATCWACWPIRRPAGALEQGGSIALIIPVPGSLRPVAHPVRVPCLLASSTCG